MDKMDEITRECIEEYQREGGFAGMTRKRIPRISPISETMRDDELNKMLESSVPTQESCDKIRAMFDHNLKRLQNGAFSLDIIKEIYEKYKDGYLAKRLRKAMKEGVYPWFRKRYNDYQTMGDSWTVFCIVYCEDLLTTLPM
jgi:hypothetical protein